MEHLTAAYDKADDTSAPSTTKKTEDFDSMKDRMALAPITPQVQDLLRKEKFVTDARPIVFDNPTYDDIVTAPQGPQLPHKKLPLGYEKNLLTGFVEDLTMTDFAFDEQYLTYHSYGYAIDPTGQYVIGDQDAATERQGKSVFDRQKKSEVVKHKRGGAPGSGSFLGPWAPPPKDPCDVNPDDDKEEPVVPLGGTDAATETAASTDPSATTSSEPGTEEKKVDESQKPKEVTRIFHLAEFRDYQGRTFMTPPTDLKPYPHKCFLPKKTGHTRGISCVRLFPRYGHLLLSAGLDNDIKIWDVYNNRENIQTYIGHQKGVRDLCFNNDGTKFLSCSYDRLIRWWDTETGDLIHQFVNPCIPYCVKLYPEGGQNEFIAGMADKKILQFDLRTKQSTLEYDGHLQAVNTVTFVDQNRRFVSSSDDKSLRIWEWGLPVPVKYISEPHMHSMPAVCAHPNGKYFLCQSLDNQILVYDARDRFKLHRKKRFCGHIVAGYACQVNFSSDARFVISGDGEGKIWFWDWKTCKAFKVIYAHHGVCIGCEWHPIEGSRVVTCGWDGKINYWD